MVTLFTALFQSMVIIQSYLLQINLAKDPKVIVSSFRSIWLIVISGCSI